MEILYPRCCGLDVHKQTVTACVITPEGQETRTFSTVTKELLALADWLASCDVTHVAMESTGVYWRPVYNLLEEGFSVLVVNAHHIKAVPGRKTDVKDAEWIANLLRHGLVRGSYVPERPQRELRELVRYRRSLIQERARAANRVQKVLEGANIKLASVASNVLGVSGRAMLEAIVAGSDDPKALAALAKGRMRAKTDALEEALQGLVGPHQRFLLSQQVRHIDFLEGAIAALDEEVAARMGPFEEAMQRLDIIPGVGPRNLQDILSETGTDMSRFPTHRHIAAWSGLCPGNDESAGRRKGGHARHGNTWLCAALHEAARAAARTKGSYFAGQYRRLAARRGSKRALKAIAHSILTVIYYMLKRGTPYQDLGENYFDERDRQATVRRVVQRMERLGYNVTLEPVAV